MSLITPLARVKGLGSAKQGTHHWWHQRLTALALVPLSLWLVYSLLTLTGADYETIVLWLGRPLSAVLFLLFVIALFHHAQLGLQVVIEDYISSEWQKFACVILVKFLAVVGALSSVLSILIVFLGYSPS